MKYVGLGTDLTTDGFNRREACPVRRLLAAADFGANLSLQDSELPSAIPARESDPGADCLSSVTAGRIMEWRKSGPQLVHQRHMPMEPKKFHIPRKTKEKKALFQFVSTESREYEDMKTILTSGYIDTNSAGCFSYSNPRLVHSELLEKEFVEKRREMKADGRTEKELEESYCFLLTNSVELPVLCEKGLTVGQSRNTVLGNPSKGVYLSRYSDLLQTNPLSPGTTGELIIFKVIKGKVKSIYDNMKILQDPTPRFDSHTAKNASKVTSLSCYRAFELTQQYFYEYLFDELRERPRQVCPYAVVSFHMKGKDTPLSIKPPPPIRFNSQSSESSQECAQFTVWTGDLVKNKRVLFQISLRSSSTPTLPHRLPEKLDIGSVMMFDEVTKLVPSGLFSFDLYSSSKEVVTEGHYCSLLEVVDRSRFTTNVTTLLRELETKRLVLVNPLTDKGFLFLLSSVQMATPAERRDAWKRSFQALFVFPESRDVSKFTLRCSSSSSSQECLVSPVSVMPRLPEFLPALHHSLVKARGNPPSNLSAGVELQTQEYLSGLNDGSVRQYPMTEYDSVLDEETKPCPPYHRVNTDGYLRSYLSNPTVYLLSVARARQAMEAHCGPEPPQEKASRNDGGPREAAGQSVQKMQQLLEQILACKKNAETEARREEGDGLKAPERKRKMEQKTAERALKYFKASLETGRPDRIPVGGNKTPASHFSFSSIITSLGVKDVDLREDGSEVSVKFLRQLKGLVHAANQNPTEAPEEGQKESSPFGRLAVKLGLPANCDIDLRKQEELEEQTAGSVSSLEGFSPSSHGGESTHHGGRGGGGRLGKKVAANEEQEEEEWEIPWVLIPITGLCSERYSQRDRNIPQDPRFQHLDSATGLTLATKSPRRSPASSPERSPPPSYPSPETTPSPSPDQCSSPIPSPPNSPSQCPSPEPSLPPSPSQCPSPEPSPPSSPFHCPSPQPSPPPSAAQSPTPETEPLLSSQCWSVGNELKPVNEQQRAPKEFPGVLSERETELQRKEIKTEEPSVHAEMDPFTVPPPALRFKSSPSHSEQVEETGGETEKMVEAKVERAAEEEEIQPEEKEQNQLEEATENCEQHEEKEVKVEIVGEQNQKRELNEPNGGSLLSSAISAGTACPNRDLDSVVDKHLEEFTSDIQLLLQDEGVNYSLSQLSHSPLTTNTPQDMLPYTSLLPFSQYVSFYNPCPSASDYVTSLHDGISGLLAEFEERWSRANPGGSGTPVDATLATTVSDFVASVRAGPACSRAEAVWEPDSANWRNPPVPRLSLSDPPSASGSVWGCLNQDVMQPQDIAAVRTVLFPAAEEGKESLTGADCTVTLPGLSSGSETEQFHSFKPVPSPNFPSALEPCAAPVPSTTHINSVIDQLEPNVLNNLAEIIKDIKRKSPQFYLHCTEPGDQVYEEVKEHLLNLGNVHQSPVDFLHQDNTENGLLVIIKNKDITGHIHQIPGLMSLKRHSSVMFVGIDSLDDIKNNSCIELFVSGGCIVSDELVLSPDVITRDQLAALLMLLEEHSSPESLWRWKIHCKTHKKLKEQARFRRDAANLLELLSSYQKRQIIDFLPYHHCDMTNHQSPDLDCLIELQARYTQFRHTVYLTEHPFDKFPAYSNGGIIVAGIEEIQHSFSRLVGCHSIKDKQLFVEDLLAPKGLSRQLDHRDSVTSYEVSPSPSNFPDQIHPVSSSNQPQEVLIQPSANLPYRPHVSDQIVPDSSNERISLTTSRDMEFLQQAIKELRAERLEQLRQLKLQQQLLELQVESDVGILANPTGTEDGHITPPPDRVAPSESVRLTPGRKAVAATLESIHSGLQLETREDVRMEDRQQLTPTEGRERPGTPEGSDPGGQRRSTAGRVEGSPIGHSAQNNIDPSSQSAAAGTDRSNPTEPDSDNKREETIQQEPVRSSGSPEEDIISRSSQFNQEQQVSTEVAPPASSNTESRIPVLMYRDRDPKPAPSVQNIQQKQPAQLPPYSQQPQRGVGLLHTPHLPHIQGQHFHPGPLLGPLRPLGGMRGVMGPPHLWPGGLAPVGSPLVWGFQQTGIDFLGSYYSPAGPGGNMYRGGRPGGGFNRMEGVWK
ncbi:protein TASOR isoform X4 [Girardinichthys multiradiatus]|uniref:protein TASOR isoform X4 n=1 Tax=Girardinichthys multiradiatus TaxID=208333 RepID=UPI001FAB8FD5|nr:protein TASOR isoform X4 [Girardinichthys multiradiatus]